MHKKLISDFMSYIFKIIKCNINTMGFTAIENSSVYYSWLKNTISEFQNGLQRSLTTIKLGEIHRLPQILKGSPSSPKRWETTFRIRSLITVVLPGKASSPNPLRFKGICHHWIFHDLVKSPWSTSVKEFTAIN